MGISMSQIFNIYCDESCHLENDHKPIMAFGALWCPQSEVQRISTMIRDIKSAYRATGELKWGKVSPSRIDFYLALVDYFFGEPGLNFRGLIVNNKQHLNHNYFNEGSHDSFYYKMYYQMLLPILRRPNKYNIYLDIKDTRSASKVRTLREVLCNTFYDFERTLIPIIQNVRSNQRNIMQLTDFFTGAIAYRNRPDVGRSNAKCRVIQAIENISGRDLVGCTPLWEEKFNLFSFTPKRSLS